MTQTVMKESNLQKLIKKLQRHKGKLISANKIKDHIHTILKDAYSDSKAYKLIYHCKNKGYILSLKKDIFLVKDPETIINEQEIIDNFYRNMVKKHAKEFIQGKRYIGGLKALELQLMNFSSPDEINVVTENKQSTEVIMFDKKLLCKKYTIKKENLFKKMYKHTEKMKIGTNSFQVAELELALLESLYSPNIVAHKYTHEIIKKAIRKYKKIFNTETIESILKTGKHHTSVNRLHTIIQSIDKKLASEIEQTIKKYSFFIDT